MPPWMWPFIIGSALAHGHTLITSVKGVDPSVQHKRSKSVIEYRVWTAPRLDGEEDRKGGCDVRYYAMVTGVTPVRLNAGGEEQLLDTSWTFDYRIKGGKEDEREFWFIDPITHETLAYRKVGFKCTQSPGSGPIAPWEGE